MTLTLAGDGAVRRWGRRGDGRRNRFRPRHFRAVLLAILSAAALTFLGNAAVVAAFHPSAPGGTVIADNLADDAEFRSVPSISLSSIPGLFEPDPGGYVDMASPEDVVLLADWPDDEVLDTDEDAASDAFFLAAHEYFHIVEKRAVAAAVGGYPSAAKPVRSALFYRELLQLNRQLEEQMPDLAVSGISLSVRGGLEAAADCYAIEQTRLAYGVEVGQNVWSVPAPPSYYSAGCSPEQVGIVMELVEQTDSVARMSPPETGITYW